MLDKILDFTDVLRSLGAVNLHHPYHQFLHLRGYGLRIVEGPFLVTDDIRQHRRFVAAQESVDGGTQTIDIRPVTHQIHASVDLFAGRIAGGIAGCRIRGGSPTLNLHLFAGTEVHQSGIVIYIHHDIGGFDIQVPDTLTVHVLQRFQNLRQEFLHLFLCQRSAERFQPFFQRLTIDEVHHIVRRSVLFKQVVHLNNIVAFQFAQSACFLLELIQLFIKDRLAGQIAHADAVSITITFGNTFHKELLDGHLLFKLQVCSRIGIAETARRKVAVNAVFTHLQRRSHKQHR